MTELLVFALYGAIGGLARALIGFLKSKNRLDYEKVVLNAIATTILGGIVGFVVDSNPITSLTAGYAGIDVAESILKLKK